MPGYFFSSSLKVHYSYTFRGGFIGKKWFKTPVPRSEFLSEGYCNKIPKAKWLKLQKCIFSPFRRLEILDRSVSRALLLLRAPGKHPCRAIAFGGALSCGTITPNFSMFFLCACLCPNFPLFLRTLVSLEWGPHYDLILSWLPL